MEGLENPKYVTTDTSQLLPSIEGALTAFVSSPPPPRPVARLEFALGKPPGKPFPGCNSWIGSRDCAPGAPVRVGERLRGVL